jgi:tRNA dimethylallyltransferase
MRALEVALSHPERFKRPSALETLAAAGFPFVKIFLDVPEDEVDRRILERTLAMLQSGLLDEAERVGAEAVAANAVGYPQALGYLAGWSTRTEMIATLTRATRRYARRQRAWFRREPEIRWLRRDEVADAARELLGWA